MTPRCIGVSVSIFNSASRKATAGGMLSGEKRVASGEKEARNAVLRAWFLVPGSWFSVLG